MDDYKEQLIQLTVDVVSAYVSNNSMPQAELANLIGSTHAALSGLVTGAAAPAAKQELVPAVSINKSVQDDHIVCLEDGRKFKSLKRHLRAKYDISPEQYRAKWGLPADYPMVAPSYAKQRSELARSIGLGQPARTPKAATAEAAPAEQPQAATATEAPAKTGRGRPKADKSAEPAVEKAAPLRAAARASRRDPAKTAA